MYFNDNDQMTPDEVRLRAAGTSRRRAPSAGDRLVRAGLITAADYARSLAAETADWAAIMTMDEAALDAAIGARDAAAIDALGVMAPKVARRSPPGLHIVGARPVRAPRPYRAHFRIRLAGVEDGLMGTLTTIEAELRGIRRLLMASEGAFLPQVFHDLERYLFEGRLLVAERITPGGAVLEGVVAYELLTLVATGATASHRVNTIPLLAVRGQAARARLAVRLCLEAQLRGTVRALQDDGPHCIGTVGVILDTNRRALAWASRLGSRARLVAARARQAMDDPALAGLRDRLEGPRDSMLRRTPYRFIVANRMQLVEAARCHLVGVTPYPDREDVADLRIDYDRGDPCATRLLKAVSGIVTRDPSLLDRLGLVGKRDATFWGPPAAASMSVPVERCPEGMICPTRAGGAA